MQSPTPSSAYHQPSRNITHGAQPAQQDYHRSQQQQALHNLADFHTTLRDPDPGTSRNQTDQGMSGHQIQLFRSAIPQIAMFTDDFIRSTPMAQLLQMAITIGAAKAPETHTASESPREADPAATMAKTLDRLRSNPIPIPAGQDNRTSILHNARFLGGIACNAKAIWLAAREAIGLEGNEAVATYDMASIGLGGCVTPRGWKELHNLASTLLQIKMFTTANLGASSAANKRLTLADGGASINVGDSLKEIEGMEELKQAVRVMCRAAQFVPPWNMAFCALEGFLISSNWCHAAIGAHSDKVHLLSDFINYILALNADAWTQKEPFLAAGDVKQKWDEWDASRVSLTMTAPASSNTYQQGGSDKKKAFWAQKRQGHHSHASSSGGSSANSNHNHQHRSGGDKFCRRYNDNAKCTNPHGNCVLPGGQKLLHLCDKVKSDGSVCKGKHPRSQHR